MVDLPAVYPCRPPSVLFRMIWVFNCVVLGLLPTVVVALIPSNAPHPFHRAAAFLVFTALTGMAWSIVLNLVRIPSRYIITQDALHIVSIARSKWWWCPWYDFCQPTYTIALSDIETASVENPMCPVPLLLLPGPWTSFTGLCCVVRGG
eukprot:CAMPEP_0174927232 /NCGR_PEP_ID=MMETSP1355-20121228/18025_1 /TAXON_ID=464990 /ORGANISM="Hemiselmis tepida, Strain CCMP443" /LENGTH=148 /DNA_ID=CAMNT_0016173321 /DNA_START=32 /DNA_END=474 /DNA_ORIENTATION=+